MAPMAKTTACAPRMSAAASGLTAETISVEHQNRGRDPGGEPGAANVDAGQAARWCCCSTRNLLLIYLLRGKGWRHASGGLRELLRVRATGAATQQLQQQQQPATRHRSTARRLVSMGSRRADTSAAYPMTWRSSQQRFQRRPQVGGLGHTRGAVTLSPVDVEDQGGRQRQHRKRRAAPDWRPDRLRRGPRRPGPSQTWSTTRRTRSQGPHHGALKCTTVGPVRDRPRSAVSASSAPEAGLISRNAMSPSGGISHQARPPQRRPAPVRSPHRRLCS